jgi:hypothetical protein
MRNRLEYSTDQDQTGQIRVFDHRMLWRLWLHTPLARLDLL